jgi:hypothetical protein
LIVLNPSKIRVLADVIGPPSEAEHIYENLKTPELSGGVRWVLEGPLRACWRAVLLGADGKCTDARHP